ncbi:Uncharacterized protein conserved in bacteria [Gordonia paraffinivorans]|uniref:Uncharacterized protein conserved in bacteria n=1 Tax=Gordonia paraffinivorans TaxID=175628 RepID=A0ABD7UZ81_9ACTN|nr:Uncharacterized protein conserved in bacteria [Gordonia paraffinivorans]
MFPEPSTSLSITVGLIADLTAINPFDFFVEDWAEHYGFEYPDDLRRDLEVYLRPVGVTEGEFAGAPVHPEVAEFAARHKPIRRTRVIDFLVAINQAVCDAVGYTVRLEAGVQTPEHTLESAMGSCRDSAWLLVALLRELGLAARFVSGYLVQLTSDVKPIDGPSGPDADFTDLHAWAEVYLPGAGWVGLDPTSGLFAGEGHIPLAATPHPSGAAPITGATGPCHATLDFSNTVTRFHEDPRVTLPYTPEQWDRVNALGAMVDERMRRNDVRLTMGGEPTFVSVDDQTAPEWTTAADGPHKRLLASRLAERLKDDYAPQGLVQRSQGKWYPGEPLPRWQIEIVWRKDGEPVWRDPSLLADPWPTQEAAAAAIETETYGSDPATLDAAPARKLLSAFAETLGLPGEQVMPAYEDPLVRMRELAGLPPGDPGSDPTARRPEAGPGGVRRRPRGPRGGRRGGAGTGVRLGGTPTETARPARRRGHRPVRLRAAAQPLRGRHRLAVRGVDAAPRPHRPDPRHLAGRSAPTPELVVVGSGADAVRGRSVGLLRRPCPPTRPRRSASR